MYSDMDSIQNREQKMREIFETAQKMKNGEIATAKSFNGVQAFIDEMKQN